MAEAAEYHNMRPKPLLSFLYYVLQRLGIYENAGVSFMFVFIAVAVALFITSAMKSSKWSYIKDEACKIDMTTTDYVKEELEGRPHLVEA